MCTSFSIKSKEGHNFFGRNMDLAYEFNQSVLIIPRKCEIEDKVTGNKMSTPNAIIGIGTIIDNHVVLADGMNEKGLVCAGLNFEGYAHFEEKVVPGKTNLAPYDLPHWVLANHENIEEVKESLKNIELVDVPLNEKTPVSMLHWMITDKSGKSIVVEKTKEKLTVHDNPIRVMTNNPTFDWHLTNLNEYIKVEPPQPKNINWADAELKPLGIGAGMLGIPGDFASVSRFVRIAYITSHMPEVENDISAVTQCFHMLDYVKMVKGGCMTQDGMLDLTLYSACMDQQQGIYYYKTYNDTRINAVDMHKEDLDASEVKVFPYSAKQDVNYQN